MRFVTRLDSLEPPIYINVRYDGSTFLFETCDILPLLLPSEPQNLPPFMHTNDLVLLLFHHGIDNLWIKEATENIQRIWSQSIKNKYGSVSMVYPKDTGLNINHNKLRGIELENE